MSKIKLLYTISKFSQKCKKKSFVYLKKKFKKAFSKVASFFLKTKCYETPYHLIPNFYIV